jgi:hypothetical protein
MRILKENPHSAEKLGESAFKSWAKKEGAIEIIPKSRNGVGYDFKVKWKDRRNNRKKIGTFEVKGTKRKLGIPDMSVNEFKNYKLKADFIFVAGNVFGPGENILYKIPRKALTRKNLKLKKTYHIKLFQNEREMGRHRIF